MLTLQRRIENRSKCSYAHGMMPFFLIIPLWLGVLAIAAGLALVRRTRVLSLYIAVSSTSALLFSMLISTALIIALAKISSYAAPAPSWAGWVMLGGYGAGIVIGGLTGALLGVFLIWWWHRRRQRAGSPSHTLRFLATLREVARRLGSYTDIYYRPQQPVIATEREHIL